MLGSEGPLIHNDIVETIQFRRSMIPWDFHISYDIDYDMTKIRFWKDHEGTRITKKYHMPTFASRAQLYTWVEDAVADFKKLPAPENEGYEEQDGYIKGAGSFTSAWLPNWPRE